MAGFVMATLCQHFLSTANVNASVFVYYSVGLQPPIKVTQSMPSLFVITRHAFSRQVGT
jgi:hypothetical protein